MLCTGPRYFKGFKMPYKRCGKLCGAVGKAVAAKDLKCTGDEKDFLACSRNEADRECRILG